MSNHGGNIYNLTEEYGLAPHEICDFSSNINPLGFPERVRGVIHTAVDTITQYPDPDYRILKESIGAYLELDSSMVIVGNGAVEIITLYYCALKPRRALIIEPTFSEYERALNSLGVTTEYYSLNKETFTFDPETLTAELLSEYDLLVLCNPNNPTGTFLDLSHLEILVNRTKETGTSLFIDESFVEFITGNSNDSALSFIDTMGHLFVLRSMTKLFAVPGLRLGYGVTSNLDLIGEVRKIQDPWSVNSLAAAVGPALLREKEYMDRTRALIRKERSFLLKELTSIPWLRAYPSAVNFLLLEIHNNTPSHVIRDMLLKKGILIRDASNFRSLDERFIRIAVKTQQDNSRLLAALRELSL